MWFRVVLDIPLKAKASGCRMGKGKGKVTLWVCNILKGFIFLEIDNVFSLSISKKVLKLARQKLRAPVQVVMRGIVEHSI